MAKDTIGGSFLLYIFPRIGIVVVFKVFENVLLAHERPFIFCRVRTYRKFLHNTAT